MFLPTDITLQPGDSGDYVLEMQRRLAQRHLLSDGNLNATYDGPTTQAVREFQSVNGLLSDGIAGPETLRRLISIGGAFGESGDGSSESSDEQDEEKDLDEIEIRHDEALLAKEEQEKLANEAVWGYGAEEAIDASREAQTESIVNEEKQTTAAVAEKRDSVQESLEQQRLAQHELEQLEQPTQQNPEQLQVDQQGVEARTPMDDLNAQPIAQDAQSQQRDAMAAQSETQTQEVAASQAEHQQQPVEPKPGFGNLDAQPETTQAPPLAQPEQNNAPQQAQAVAQTETTPAPRDPELMRTEAQLDQGSQMTSQEEGKKLHTKGVKDNGKVPESELGEMSPAQTPAIEQSREVGLGG